MSKQCSLCRAHEKAYELFDRDSARGVQAIERTLEPYLEHLRNAEAESYQRAMEGFMRSGRSEKNLAPSFLDQYARVLRLAFAEAGCDVELARNEVRAWVPGGERDYSGVRIGLTLLEGDHDLADPQAAERALSA